MVSSHEIVKATKYCRHRLEDWRISQGKNLGAILTYNCACFIERAISIRDSEDEHEEARVG